MAKVTSEGRIRAALLELLKEKPIEKVTVTEVVNLAGVSRVTYYRLFYSLHGVIDSALDDLFSQISGIISASGLPNASFDSQRAVELATYRALLLYQEKVSLLQPLLMGNLSSETVERIYRLALGLIPQDDGNEMMRHYVAGGMTTVIVDWLRDGCKTPVEDVLAFIEARRDM